MSIVSITTVKSYFETGDKPTQVQFGDFIDTAIRPSMVAVASGVEGGATGVVVYTSAAGVSFNTAGSTGLQILSAATTASAQGHLGFGNFGSSFVGAGTTAQARDLLNISTTGTAATILNDLADVSAASATDGSILVNWNGDWISLERGTSGQSLTGGGSALAWASSGGWEHIETLSAPSSAVFESSAWSSDFDEIEITLSNVFDSPAEVQFQGFVRQTGGSYLTGYSTSGAVDGTWGDSNTFINVSGGAIRSGATGGLQMCKIWIGRVNATEESPVTTRGQGINTGSGQRAFHYDGIVDSAVALDRFKVEISSGTFTGGTMVVKGLKY